MAVKPIPDGYHTVTPYLAVKGAKKLIEFLEQAFDAEVIRSTSKEADLVGNAEIKIGDSMIMVADAGEQWTPMPMSFYLYVEDTDALYHKAIAAGGTSLMEPADQFYGDRNAGVQDASGNMWWIATHIEDVTDEEIQRRADARG